MLSSLQIAALILAAGGLLTACQRPQEWKCSLEEFLTGRDELLAQAEHQSPDRARKRRSSSSRKPR